MVWGAPFCPCHGGPGWCAQHRPLPLPPLYYSIGHLSCVCSPCTASGCTLKGANQKRQNLVAHRSLIATPVRFSLCCSLRNYRHAAKGRRASTLLRCLGRCSSVKHSFALTRKSETLTSVQLSATFDLKPIFAMHEVAALSDSSSANPLPSSPLSSEMLESNFVGVAMRDCTDIIRL